MARILGIGFQGKTRKTPDTNREGQKAPSFGYRRYDHI